MVRSVIYSRDKPTNFNPYKTKITSIIFKGKFHINCSLGDCGMTVSTNDDGSELTYAIQIGTSRFWLKNFFEYI